jgi:hypothetical protein
MNENNDGRLILDFLDNLIDFMSSMEVESKIVTQGNSLSLYNNDTRIFTKNKGDDEININLDFYATNLEKSYRLFSYRS